MEGIKIQSADPPNTGTAVYPGFQSYVFERAIPPGDTLDVKVRATAVKAGEFPGWINVCINTGTSCSTLQGAFLVAE